MRQAVCDRRGRSGPTAARRIRQQPPDARVPGCDSGRPRAGRARFAEDKGSREGDALRSCTRTAPETLLWLCLARGALTSRSARRSARSLYPGTEPKGSWDTTQSTVALTREIVENANNDLGLRKIPNNVDGPVRASAVDDRDAPCPCQLAERPANVGFFVMSQDSNTDIVREAHVTPCSLSVGQTNSPSKDSNSSRCEKE
jgi:hypothetical protein